MKAVCRILLFFLMAIALGCGHTYHISEAQLASVEINDELPQDSSLNALLEPYREQLQKEMNQVIGYSSTRLIKGAPESTMGNWMADCIHMQAQKNTTKPVDISLQNKGGLRISEIPVGPITRGRIFELMPFDNAVVVLDLEASRLQMLLDHIASSGGWPSSRTLGMEIDHNKATKVLVHGKPLDPKRVYRVALPDYVANGGSDCDFLRGIEQENTGVLVRDMLIRCVLDATENQDSISTALDGRMSLTQ